MIQKTHPASLGWQTAAMHHERSAGWVEVKSTPKPGGVWAEQARVLAEKRLAMPARISAQHERSVHERVKLLQHLESKGIPQGMAALWESLRLRFETIEKTFMYLDVSRPGSGGLSVLELAGSLALLGVDTLSLCGFDERELHRRLDADGDGRVGLRDLLREFHTNAEVAANPTSDLDLDHAADNTDGVPDDRVAAASSAAFVTEDAGRSAPTSRLAAGGSRRDLWMLLVKFVTLSAWFYTPSQVRKRGVGDVDEASDAEPQASGKSLSSIRKQLDSLRLCWSPNEDDLGEVQSAMQEIFNEHATVRQFGVQLLGRSDADSIVASLSDQEKDPAAAAVSRDEVGRIFDRVLENQVSQTADGRFITKGLTVESLRALLYEFALSIGLHFRHLVEDALDAYADGYRMPG
eukprot:gnl/TRDRNA2_/TRDRNA2_165511_c0_seq4.p1 gnl/TRDRNA2_/TRDRNA2_165511_c0~~gnl/TRDRNA2_/TRDRNA2_165511_c0_seq4.p1  ORF type:complete len:407 (+),score=82.91 gnl/TRDRNA2_/TRDRNA2_165511_c0_seq4:177-1397(+)